MIEGFKEVDPVHKRENNGKVYEHKYTYRYVVVDEIPNDISTPSKVELDVKGGRAIWEYEGKVPVHIRQGRTFVREDAPIKEARNQAYFCLNFLADEGYVAGWMKQ